MFEKIYIKRSIKEKNIGTIDFSTWIQDSFIISPDSNHLAYLSKKDEEWYVVRDDSKFKKYFNIDSLVFSPDSENIAYQAIEIKLLDETVNGVKVGKLIKKSFVVVNTDENKNYYDDIGKNAIIFSPDSNHIVYAARKNNRWFIIKDDIKYPQSYDGIGTIIFSPNSERLVYSARIGNKWFVVDGGNPQKNYDQIGKGSLIFSPNSEKLVYTAKENEKWFIVEEGKEKSEKGEGVGQPVFSPDSKHLAYVIAQNGSQMLIVDDNPQEKFKGVSTPVFSPNSNDYAYIAGNKNKMFVVYNKDKKKEYDGIVENSLLFSPNSESFVYVGLNKKLLRNKYFINRDDDEIKLKYDGIGEKTLIFSPDSKHFAFGIERKHKWYMVIDSNICKKYDGIGFPIFSPNSEYFVYVAAENGKFCLVINENEGEKYAAIVTIAGGKVVFDSTNSLHYIAQNSIGSFCLIHEEIK